DMPPFFGNITLPKGSYIVRNGIVPQSFANALKPYGFAWDMIKNHGVPVGWAINPGKLNVGDADFTDGDGNTYFSGAFFINANYVDATVVSTINTWRASGVQIY